MASFIAKQLVGKQLDSVKGAIGKDEGEGGEAAKEIDPELQEALREAEEKRQEKHRKMEEERETMRQEIRDKYGLKKKEEEIPWDGNVPNQPAGRLGRTRKTPEELRAEATAEDEEDEGITSFLPENMREIANKVTEGPGKLVAEATEKCTIQ